MFGAHFQDVNSALAVQNGNMMLQFDASECTTGLLQCHIKQQSQSVARRVFFAKNPWRK